MGAGDDLLGLFPWLGDAFDNRNRFEASSAHDGEAEHTGADPTDLQHVSDEVLEDAMGRLHAARVALAEGLVERTSDFRTRLLGGHETLAATGSACEAIQGYGNTVEARASANSTASKSQCVFTRGISATALQESKRAWSAQRSIFMNAERAGTFHSVDSFAR